MKINHHPADELLLGYAAGATSEAFSLVIATHLALCPTCRCVVAQAESVGGAMLESATPVPLNPGALDSVLSRLDEPAPPPPDDPAKSTSKNAAGVPEPLRSYVGGDFDAVPWTKITQDIAFKLVMKTGDMRAHLVRSKAGHGVGTHAHRGEELTLVLTGGYTDVTGRYAAGDVQYTTPEIVHRPLADEGGDCIALVVSDGSLKFRSFLERLGGWWFGF